MTHETLEDIKNLTKEERLYRATLGALAIGERGDETISPAMCGIVRAMLIKTRTSQWNTDMEAAPRGGGAEMVTDPDYVDPPKILLGFEDSECRVCHWDWYYAEGGSGYEGHLAWVLADAGELAVMYHDAPVKWMHLPE